MRNLFILGDSISIHYGPHLKKMVEGRFHYDRKRGEDEALADLDNPIGANGGDSGMVLEYLRSEQEKGIKYDLLLVNCGLHDIKTDPLKGEKQVPADKYRENLEQIVDVAQQMAQTFIWNSFTRQFGHASYSDHVHFTEEIQSLQAAYIAGYLDCWLTQ